MIHRGLLSLCLTVSLLLSISSCVTTIHLPEEELLKLFQIKEQAQTDGRFVKRKIEKNPTLETRKEVIAFKAEYSKLSGSYNGAIEFLKTKVGTGDEPSGYIDTLKREFATIKTQADKLHSLSESIALNRGPMILELANVATSQLADVIVTLINTSKRIEQYERENVKSQLAQQRMKEYGDL